MGSASCKKTRPRIVRYVWIHAEQQRADDGHSTDICGCETESRADEKEVGSCEQTRT